MKVKLKGLLDMKEQYVLDTPTSSHQRVKCDVNPDDETPRSLKMVSFPRLTQKRLLIT